jgi:cation diffusion facilitator CzcD-associated flavoprotein CzcO
MFPGMIAEPFAAIVGTGFSGVAAAAGLKRAGIDDLVLLERASSLGGTWRDNTYPGCACDIPSHLYSFSFLPEASWTRAFAPQHEIRAYLERCADALDLRRHVAFGRAVTSAAWEEARGRWVVRTGNGAELCPRVLVLATGALSNPALPHLPGAERFRGARFHSAAWDAACELRGKRVAVIGTGASAVQLVPRIQPLVERLHVFQRTPPWILPRGDRPFRGWERALFRHLPAARWLYRASIFWRLEGRVLAFTGYPGLMALVERQARRHMERSVADPALRALLTPSYRAGCKRILLSDDYYPALVQPNVEVVAEAVREADERGLVLESGRVLELDAIVYATGFAVHDHLGGLAVTGRDGATLRAAWREGGARAYLGTMVSGFPNLFLMTGPNTGLGHNSMVVMIEGQARWVSRAVRLLRDRALASVEPTPEAERAYADRVRRRNAGAVWSTGCRSWYLDEQGRNTTLWPGTAAAFRLRTARLRLRDLRLGEAVPA